MLTLVQAEGIARDCISLVAASDVPITAGKTLAQLGIVDPESRKALNEEIVTNPQLGVPRFGHKLGANSLTFGTGTKFFQLCDEIAAKAVGVSASPRAFALTSLTGVGAGAKVGTKSKSAARKGAKKASKKAAQKAAGKASKKAAKKAGSKKGSKKSAGRKGGPAR